LCAALSRGLLWRAGALLVLSFPELGHRQEMRRHVEARHARGGERVGEPPGANAGGAADVQHGCRLRAPVLLPELLQQAQQTVNTPADDCV